MVDNPYGRCRRVARDGSGVLCFVVTGRPFVCFPLMSLSDSTYNLFSNVTVSETEWLGFNLFCADGLCVSDISART